MICPSCDYENIEGVDCCENCMQDLTGLDQPEGTSPLEQSIMEATVARLHPNPPVVVGPDTTVAAAIGELCRHSIGCVIVGSKNEVQGIFSERDVLLRIAHRYEECAASPVSEFMTKDPELLEVTSPIAFALNRMSLGDFRHLPITREGQLVGIVSLRDVLGFLNEWYPDLIAAG